MKILKLTTCTVEYILYIEHFYRQLTMFCYSVWVKSVDKSDILNLKFASVPQLEEFTAGEA